MAASLSKNGYNMPTEVIQLISGHCDDSTLYAFMRTSRSYLKLATPILYEHITISSVTQLERFKDCVQEQSLHADSPGTTSTQDFTLALHTAAAWPRPLPPQSMQRTIDHLQKVPHTSEKTGALFPNLIRAYLLPIRGYRYYTFVSIMSHKLTFLKNVRHLHLFGDETSGAFALPDCPALGINLLLDIHLYNYHVSYDPSLCELAGGFWRFIGDQQQLTTVHVYHESQACLYAEEAQLEEVGITETLLIPPAHAVTALERLHYDTDRIASLCGELAYSTGKKLSKDRMVIKECLFYQLFIPKLENILIKVPAACSSHGWYSSVLLRRLQAGIEMAREQLMGIHDFTPAPTIKIKWTQDQGSNEERDMEAELVRQSRLLYASHLLKRIKIQPGIEDEPWRLSGLH